MPQRFANIELAKKYNSRYREWSNKIFVTYNGERIGDISIQKPDRWDPSGKDRYSCSYFIDGENDNRGGDYAGHFSTLFAAKNAVLQQWKENSKPKKAPYAVSFLPSGDNSDFFPTPSGVAGKMMAMVDWADVRSILEPSAGKGDLIECARQCTYMRNRYDRDVGDVDCIELDQNLRYILTGKGFRVVYDDFLSFHTHKRYNLILMNPPFSQGDKHLLKALELQENGGQIVCLLNAETLRNPYTMQRKMLLDRLHEANAKIVYVKGAFARAERSSDVEVAIVQVKIADKEFESQIFSRMKKAYDPVINGEQPKGLVGGSYIQQLITSYEIETSATMELFREFNAMRPYQECGSESYKSSLICIKIGDSSYDTIGVEAANHYMRRVRAKYWDKLLHLPQITDRFTSKLMERYQGQVDRMKDYDFSMFNIQQVIDELNASLVTGVHETIMALFDRLSAQHSWYPECGKNIHYFNGWATNKAHKINKKVILPINGFSSYSWEQQKLDEYSVSRTLSDIEKTLDYLDRGATMDFELSRIIHCAVARSQTKNIACKYFNVTFYKKGTCHIVFHEQRIVDQLNIYGSRGKNWLPPNYGKTHYRDMDEESKAVIDSFQGEDSYETVVSNPDVYLPNVTTPLLSERN